MAWNIIRQKEGDPQFILAGEGQIFRGRIWRGAMRGDAFYGIRALENPLHAQSVSRTYRVRTPQRWAGESNTGENRRVVQMAPLDPGVEIVFRFDREIPHALLEALRVAFREPQPAEKPPQEGESHEEHRGSVDGQADGQEGRGPGQHSGGRQGGEAPRNGLRARLRRDGEKVAPASRKQTTKKRGVR